MFVCSICSRHELYWSKSSSFVENTPLWQPTNPAWACLSQTCCSLQDGSWTVKVPVWSSHRPATCPLVPVSGFVWARLWPRWSFSSSCRGSCSASPSLYHQDTLCPVWRASLVWCYNPPSTRWMLHPDQAGRESARHVVSPKVFFCIYIIHQLVWMQQEWDTLTLILWHLLWS